MKTSTTNTEKIYTQHEENKEWAAKLDFFRDEIKVMENRIEEIVSKNTTKEILARSEQFQNRLIINKNTIDILKHKINVSNDEIRSEILKNETAVDHRSIKDHSELRNEMKIFDMNFTSLKSELNLFLVKWM